jgi:hypothetical protein
VDITAPHNDEPTLGRCASEPVPNAVEHRTDPVPAPAQGSTFCGMASNGDGRFERTQVRYGLREMNREWRSQSLAGEDGMLDPDKATKKPEMLDTELDPHLSARARWAEEERRSRVDAMGRHSPIGALPAAAEALPPARFAEVLEDAQRYLGMIRSGVRDITTGAVKLARVPVDMALVAAQKFRPLRA